jgi:hypothetical protein
MQPKQERPNAEIEFKDLDGVNEALIMKDGVIYKNTLQ